MRIDQERTRSSRMFVAGIRVILVFALVLAMLPTTTAFAVTCKFKHTVEAGETLIYLGYIYQVNWFDIAEANNIGAPYVLTVGQKLCIPGGVKPSDTTGTGTGTKTKSEATLTVVPSVGHILISVENFPKKTPYFVRIFPRGNPVSYKIGHFITNKEGDFTDWMLVPSYVPRSPQMTVCVKNMWTDATSCVTVDDVYPQLSWFSGSSCPKNAK
jgi:hypothetical protein